MSELGPICLDAGDVIRLLMPSISVRTWRRMDSASRIPRGIKIGGRKVWRVADIKTWIEHGCPDRERFEFLSGIS